jgi:hypothetical protein
LGKSLAGQQGGGSEAELNDEFAAIRHGKNPQGLENGQVYGPRTHCRLQPLTDGKAFQYPLIQVN